MRFEPVGDTCRGLEVPMVMERTRLQTIIYTQKARGSADQCGNSASDMAVLCKYRGKICSWNRKTEEYMPLEVRVLQSAVLGKQVNIKHSCLLPPRKESYLSLGSHKYKRNKSAQAQEQQDWWSRSCLEERTELRSTSKSEGVKCTVLLC